MPTNHPGGPGRLLTLGGRTAAPVGALLLLMAVATVGGSLSPPFGRWLILQVPERGTPALAVLSEPWRLLTWALFQGPLPSSLVTLLFGGWLLAWIGGELARSWGAARLLWYLLALTLGGGGLALAVLAPFAWPVGWFGLWPVVNALAVTSALQAPERPVSWLGAVRVRGRTAAWALTLATPLWALLVTPGALPASARLLLYLPHLTALAMAWGARQLTATWRTAA